MTQPGAPNFLEAFNTGQDAFQTLSKENVVIQSPDVMIFRNGINVYAVDENSTVPEDTDIDSTARRMDAHTQNLLQLSINATIQTQPSTASMAFAVPTTEPGTDKVTYVEELDFKNENLRWRIMDNVEVWTSAGVNSDNERTYVRSFVGVVKKISFEIKQNIYYFTIELSDMFYWLDRSRIQTQWSSFDLAMRRPGSLTSDPENSQVLIYKNRFQGLNFRHIIEKVLFDVKLEETITAGSRAATDSKFEEREGTEDFNAIATYSGGDMMSFLSLIGGTPDTALQYDPDYYNAVARNQRQVKNNVEAVKVSDGIPLTVEQGLTQAQLKDMANKPKSISGIYGGFITSFSDMLDVRTAQQRNYQALSMFWDIKWKQYIRQNYVALFRLEDMALQPFPYDSNASAPLVFQGNYTSRLEALNQLSQQTLYEIYQAPQGYIFAKPPLFNGPPINSFSMVEVESTSKSEDLSEVLTATTTEGAVVFRTEEQEKANPIPEIQVPNNNVPFVLGMYQVLFPKGYKGESDTMYDFTDKPFEWSISSVSDYTTIAKEIEKQSHQFSDLALTIKLQFGKSNDASIEDKKDTLEYTVTNPARGTDTITIALLYTFYKKTLDPIALSGKKTDTDIGLYTDMDSLNRLAAETQSLRTYFQWIEVHLVDNRTRYGVDVQEVRRINNEVLRFIKSILTDSDRRTSYNKKDPVGAELRRRDALTLDLNSKNLYDVIYNAYTSRSSGSSGNVAGGTDTVTADVLRDREKELIDGYIEKQIKDLDFEAMKKQSMEAPDYKKGEDKTLEEYKEEIIQKEKQKLSYLNYTQLAGRPSVHDATLRLFMSGIYDAHDTAKYVSRGEYNIMQHGFRDAKITNSLIRTNYQAALFSKYYIYKQNSMAKQYNFSLKSYRPDIVPGFPILNKADMCVYYVLSATYGINMGADTTTQLTCVVRRRPVFMHKTFPVPKDNDAYLKLLLEWEQYTAAYEEEPELTSDLRAAQNNNYQFLGWELYGPTDNNLDDIYTNEGEGAAFTGDRGSFLPPFGGYLTGHQYKSDIFGNRTDTPPGRVTGFTFYKMEPLANPNKERYDQFLEIGTGGSGVRGVGALQVFSDQAQSFEALDGTGLYDVNTTDTQIKNNQKYYPAETEKPTDHERVIQESKEQTTQTRTFEWYYTGARKLQVPGVAKVEAAYIPIKVIRPLYNGENIIICKDVEFESNTINIDKDTRVVEYDVKKVVAYAPDELRDILSKNFYFSYDPKKGKRSDVAGLTANPNYNAFKSAVTRIVEQQKRSIKILERRKIDVTPSLLEDKNE